MVAFQYDSTLAAAYPLLVGGVILAGQVHNGPAPEALCDEFQTTQKDVIARIGATPLSELPSLAAWRGVFRSFGVDPTQYRNAAEALLRRLTKKGDIPGINLLVDLGNLVSIRYALPVAVFDIRTLQGSVTVHFADGSERYTTLGESEVDHPQPGEVVFSDENKLVIARRWCWRQSEQSAASAETRSAIITVEAHHPGGHRDIEAALNDLLALLQEYTGGNFISAVLDTEHPALTS